MEKKLYRVRVVLFVMAENELGVLRGCYPGAIRHLLAELNVVRNNRPFLCRRKMSPFSIQMGPYSTRSKCQTAEYQKLKRRKEKS